MRDIFEPKRWPSSSRISFDHVGYVYSQRVAYIDKETFCFIHMENYDQKGRLYRTFDQGYGWHPEMGGMSFFGGIPLAKDYIDLHTSLVQYHVILAFWSRDEVSLRGVIKRGKCEELPHVLLFTRHKNQYAVFG